MISQHRHEAAKSHGYFAPAYEAGQYVVVTKQGHVYPLDRSTLEERAENIQARLHQIDGTKQLTLTQAKEVMTFWRSHDDKPQKEQTGPSVSAPAIGRAASTALGGAVRLGEYAFNALGGVLDYLFGGLAGTRHETPERETTAKPGRQHRHAVKDPNKDRINRMERVDLTQPATRAFLESQGNAHADLLADLRRQIEDAKKRDGSRER